MELVPYQQFYEFHFWAGLRPEKLAQFLNILPLNFKFRPGPGDIFFDPERGPGVFSLHLKQYPSEEKPIPGTQANYYLRWAARASEGSGRRQAIELTRRLSAELETRVWLLDGYGRPIQSDIPDDFLAKANPLNRSAGGEKEL